MDSLKAYDVQMLAFGKATELLFRTSRKAFSIAAAQVWLTPPIRLQQIVFSETARGQWTSYITWAYLSADVGARMIYDPPYLELSDWNEGDQLWIIDAVGTGGAIYGLADRLKRRLGRDHRTAYRLIRDRDGRVTGVRTLPLRGVHE